MTKKTQEDTSDKMTIFIRLEREMVDKIDRYVETLRSELEGLNVSRSAGIRILLSKALKECSS